MIDQVLDLDYPPFPMNGTNNVNYIVSLSQLCNVKSLSLSDDLWLILREQNPL